MFSKPIINALKLGSGLSAHQLNMMDVHRVGSWKQIGWREQSLWERSGAYL